MAQIPEAGFYKFEYSDGHPASFVEIRVFAVIAGGTGNKILVFGGGQRVFTNGEGVLLRIQKQKSWLQAELHVIDNVAHKSAVFPVHAGRYKLNWPRPIAFADFDNQQFTDPQDFLQYTSMRYGFLAGIQPSPLTFRLFRVGSPAERPVTLNLFLRLQEEMKLAAETSLALDPGDSSMFSERVEEVRLRTSRSVLWALGGIVPTAARTAGRHSAATLAAGYDGILKAIATDRTKLDLGAIFSELNRLLKGRPSNQLVIAETEDWLLASVLIFLVGLIPYGYNVLSTLEDSDSDIITVWIQAQRVPVRK